MPFVTLPLGIRVALEYEVFGKIVVNVYHVQTADPIITVKLVDIAEIFRDWWLNSLSPEFSEDISLNSVTALDMTQVNGEKIQVVVSPPLPGLRANPATSNNVALVSTFNTAKTGRSFKGRAYHAGMTEVSITGNQFALARAADIVAAYGDLMVNLVAQNVIFVVASFVSGGAPRVTGVATAVESIAVNTRVDTQRRRLPRL